MSLMEAAASALGLAQAAVIGAERDAKHRARRHRAELERQRESKVRDEHTMRTLWRAERDAWDVVNEHRTVRDRWLNAIAMHAADWAHMSDDCPICESMQKALVEES